MSFVTTRPESLLAAAANLQQAGSTMAAQNAAAATPTAGVVPAAADDVSALQAMQFSAYGSLYQQISEQAQAIHEMFVNTLGSNSGSYDNAENSNAASGLSGSSGLSGILGGLTGSGSVSSGGSGLLASSLSNGSMTGAMQASAFGAAASEFTGLGKAGFITGATGANAPIAGMISAGATSPDVLGATVPETVAAPVGPAAASGAAPVLASAGQGSSVGGLSVPPSWGEPVGAASNPVRLAGTGWTTAAPATPPTTLATGMPAAAAAGRGGYGYGVPRYGIKPKVMSRRPRVV
jgi:PPE-repeat protein